jgi:hypothetical protein
MKGHAHLTLDQAADFLGMTGRFRAIKLRRIILRREAETKKRILIRFGEKRTNWRITVASIERHLPEMVSKQDDMATQIAEAVTEFTRKIDDLYQRDAALARRIRKLETAAALRGTAP